jgi:predicted Zn-dependent protease
MVNVIGVLRSQELFAAEQARARGEALASGDNWLASHPSNEQRLRAIREHAARYAALGGFGDDGRERYLAAIDGLRYGESPEQGLTRGSQFYHPVLGFAITAPPGWRIVNTAERLTLLSPRNEAALLLVPVPNQGAASHEQVAQRLFANRQGQLTRGNINGLKATAFRGTVTGKDGRQRQAELTLVSGPGDRHHYLMLAQAVDAAALQRHRDALLAAGRSLRPLGEADREAARPWQIRIVPMPRGGFAELQRQSVVSEAELRLLNGVYEGGREPAPGERVKVVVAGR